MRPTLLRRARVAVGALGAAALLGAATDARATPRPGPAAASVHAAPRRIALLIGIADYRHFVAGGPPGRSDLRGPANDVARMRASLVGYGFTDSADVRVLVDSGASRARIAAAFAWVRTRVRDSSDVVVIYYSRHGSQVADADGDEARVAADDRLDEALVPWDARDPRVAGEVITDDALDRWLAGIRTSRLAVIVDACFSGTITRDIGPAIPRGLTAPGAAPPPGQRRRDAAQIDTRFPVLTAAGPYETAVELPWADMGGRYSGVMTHHLTRLLDAAVGTGARFDELLPLLRRDMRHDASHTAGIDGDSAARHAVVFAADRGFARRAFWRAAPAGDGWRLEAGVVHGVRPGTVLELFAPDDAEMTSAAIATLVVDSVGETTSRARATGATRGVARAGSRAVPSRMPPGLQAVTRLAVHVPATEPALRALVAALPFATLADSAAATVRLARDGGGVAVQVDGDRLTPLAPDAAPLAWATSAVAGAAGAFPPAAEALCTALRRAYVARALGSVTNPTRSFAVGLELRVVPAGTDVAALPLTTVDTLYEGERYDVVVVATGTGAAPRYLSVALEGYRGAPLQLWPQPGAAPVPYAELNRGPRALLTAPIAAPHGPERIVAYLGDVPYAFAAAIDAAPRCTAPGDRRTRALDGTDASLAGWTSVERKLLVLPPRSTAAPTR